MNKNNFSVAIFSKSMNIQIIISTIHFISVMPFLSPNSEIFIV